MASEQDSTLDRRIAHLEDRDAELRQELKQIGKALYEARCEKAGVRVGDVVRCTRDQRLYQVVEVKPFARRLIFLKGNPQRKDGSFGTAVRQLHTEWEHVEQEH